MRVLHVLSELRASGAEVMLRTAGPLWGPQGIAADVLAISEHVGPFAEDLKEAGYGVRHVPRTPRLSLLKGFSSLLRAEHYDIIHIHSEWAFMHLALVARAHGAAVVRTVHSNFPFEGRLQRERRLQRLTARRAGVRFVAISQRVAENEARRFGNPTTRVDNWFDSQRFGLTNESDRSRSRSHLDIATDDFVAVTIGNCSPTKNHSALLRALAALPVPMLLLHVGEEEEGQPEQRLLDHLGAQDRCRFLGRTDPLSALQAADLFVMPSLYEGFSIASLEALATGLPAVLTEVPGNIDLRELVPNAVWSATDAESLGTALAIAHQEWSRAVDQEERAAQSERLLHRFGPDRGVAGYGQVYQELTH